MKGEARLPANQLGSGFTGTSYITDPDSYARLSRYCRTL